MSAFTLPLARWFRDHHGIASSHDLLVLNLSSKQRRSLLQRGVLEEVFEGVYHLASTPLDFEARCAAVCAADVSLVISCCSAGALSSLRRCSSRRIHATTDRVTKPLGRGVIVHRTKSLPAGDVVDRGDGIRVTSAARTLFDQAKHVDDLTLISIGEQILDLELATVAELRATVARLAVSGRPGGARATRVMASRGDGPAADSHDEVVLLEALRQRGLRSFVRQPAVLLLDGRTVHPDLGDPAVGFYVEVDHHTWHSKLSAVAYDKERDRKVRLTGVVVERVTDTAIAANLSGVVGELVGLYIQRRHQVGIGRSARGA